MTTRQMTPAAAAALKTREGCKLDAYQDDGGVWTIGYGETDGVHEGMAITQEQADTWFAREVQPYEDAVEQNVKVDLNDNQFGALVSFVYNVGVPAFLGSTLLKKLNAGCYTCVPGEMLKWVNVHGKRDDGLVNRRNSEGGQWVSGAFVRGAAITPDEPPPIWKHPVVVKGAAAIGSAMTATFSHVTSDDVSKAAAAAQDAASKWHAFGTVGMILSGLLVVWILSDHLRGK
jgi:lysozyme